MTQQVTLLLYRTALHITALVRVLATMLPVQFPVFWEARGGSSTIWAPKFTWDMYNVAKGFGLNLNIPQLLWAFEEEASRGMVSLCESLSLYFSNKWKQIKIDL